MKKTELSGSGSRLERFDQYPVCPERLDPDPVCLERLDPDPVCPERLDPDPDPKPFLEIK